MVKTHNWDGFSGAEYEFGIYPFDFDPPNGAQGIYIFAKMVKGEWHAVYIGQGNLKERLEAQREKGCVTRKKATDVHCYSENVKQERLDIEEDLLEGNQEAYAPNGCNKKEGG